LFDAPSEQQESLEAILVLVSEEGVSEYGLTEEEDA